MQTNKFNSCIQKAKSLVRFESSTDNLWLFISGISRIRIFFGFSSCSASTGSPLIPTIPSHPSCTNHLYNSQIDCSTQQPSNKKKQKHKDSSLFAIPIWSRISATCSSVELYFSSSSSFSSCCCSNSSCLGFRRCLWIPQVQHPNFSGLDVPCWHIQGSLYYQTKPCTILCGEIPQIYHTFICIKFHPPPNGWH